MEVACSMKKYRSGALSSTRRHSQGKVFSIKKCPSQMQKILHMCGRTYALVFVCLFLLFPKCLHFHCTRGCSSTDHSPNQWRPSNGLCKLNTNLPHILYNINKSMVKSKSINCIESTYQLLFHSLPPLKINEYKSF